MKNHYFCKTTKTYLRRTISISFIVLLFLSQAGYYVYYAAQRNAARQEMKEQLETGIPQNALVQIVLEDNSLKWVEPGREFYLDGKLFDVASVSKQGEKTLLNCVSDNKESDVMQGLAKFLKAGTDTNTDGKTSGHLLKFLLSDYIVQSHEKLFLSVQLTGLRHAIYDAVIHSVVTEVNAPPPRA